MDDEPGLLDLPEPEQPAPSGRTARGRARERFARRVVVDVLVVDAAAPEEEIATGVAAALQWCVEGTDGMWPLLETGAARVDAIDLVAEERGPSQVRASWTVTIKIADAADVRELAMAACPVTDQAARAEIEASFAPAGQRTRAPR